MDKKETKNEAFTRIANSRVNKINKQIDLFKNFSNKSFYEFSNEDVNGICDQIIANVNSVREALINANA